MVRVQSGCPDFLKSELGPVVNRIESTGSEFEGNQGHWNVTPCRVSIPPMRGRFIPTSLLLVLCFSGCTEPSFVSERELGPIVRETTEVKVKILALVYGDDGFRCDYEVMEDAGTFKKGQRAQSAPLIKNLEEPIVICARDSGHPQCVFRFDKEGNIKSVSVKVLAEPEEDRK